MSINSKDSYAVNNSNGKRTAQPSEMGKFSTPEQQAAFDAGRALGRTEGMLYYIKHASEKYAKGGGEIKFETTGTKSGSIKKSYVTIKSEKNDRASGVFCKQPFPTEFPLPFY